MKINRKKHLVIQIGPPRSTRLTVSRQCEVASVIQHNANSVDASPADIVCAGAALGLPNGV